MGSCDGVCTQQNHVGMSMCWCVVCNVGVHAISSLIVGGMDGAQVVGVRDDGEG